MRPRGRAGACVTASVALFFASVPAAGAAKKITGKLSSPGYTVIALDGGGEAASALAQANGKFKLRPPSKRVSLHLRAADGIYAGPVVIERAGKRGKRAILGLEAGSKLGKVKVRDGYAKLKEELPREDQDRTRKALANKGVPIGAAVFGRVVAAATGAPGPGRDQDLDGIPGALDIDDDGDLVLDNLDGPTPSPGMTSATAARGTPSPHDLFDIHSGLDLPIYDTANANAPGLTGANIEAALPRFGTLDLEALPSGSAELDCGGLVYCSGGGTGRVPTNLNPPEGPEFPECCDLDGDGFGLLAPAPNSPPTSRGMSLLHGATSDQIGTGDVLIRRVGDPPSGSESAATLQYVFATVPALVSYTDTAGNAATVSYPVQGPYSGPPSGFVPPGPGAKSNGFAVEPGPDGDIVVTLTYWRPQRRPIPGEEGHGVPGAWTDIGGLTYTAGIADLGIPPCPQGTFSEVDPNLGSPTLPIPGGLTDAAPDQPAAVENTFTLTLNLSECLSSHQISWTQGEEHDLRLGAAVDNASGTAGQAVSFKWP